MKNISIMLCVWGCLGAMELAGMEVGKKPVSSLKNQCCAYIAKHITALRQEDGVIDWNILQIHIVDPKKKEQDIVKNIQIPDHLKKNIISQVPLDSDHMWPLLKNVFALSKSEPSYFKDSFESGIQLLLGASSEVIASVMLNADKMLDEFDLDNIKHDLPYIIIDEQQEDTHFPSSIVQYQAIFGQQPEVERNEQKAQINDRNQLIVSSQGQQKASFSLDQNAVISALQFNDKGNKVIAGFKNGSVRMFNVDAEDNCFEVAQHSLAIGSVGMNSEETVVAYAPMNRECLLRGLNNKASIKIKHLENSVKQIKFVSDHLMKLTLIDGSVIEREVPHRYLMGNLNNQELLLAHMCKKMTEDASEVLSENICKGIEQLIEKESLFEDSVRTYIYSVILRGKVKSS